MISTEVQGLSSEYPQNYPENRACENIHQVVPVVSEPGIGTIGSKEQSNYLQEQVNQVQQDIGSPLADVYLQEM